MSEAFGRGAGPRGVMVLGVSLLAWTSTACATTGAGALTPERRLTPGLVQREVHAGMPTAEVAGTLGSPNIVTRNADGREVWIYDRMFRETVETRLAGWAGGAGPVGAGVLAGGGSGSEKRTINSQTTFTVLVRFDAEGRVEDVRFHSSRF